jgi:hypothetical protein
MPSAVSSAAMARRDVCPAARISARIGARSRAKVSALAATVACNAVTPLPASFSAAAPLGLPSVTPSALATASVAVVHREIAYLGLRNPVRYSTAAPVCLRHNPSGQKISRRSTHHSADRIRHEIRPFSITSEKRLNQLDDATIGDNACHYP